LDLNRKTGVLTVTSPLRHNRGNIFFDRGAIIYASIQSNPHPLGGLLIRGGKITEADLHCARDMQRRGDSRRLGEILVSIGALAPRELQNHVRFQVEEVVFEILNWREGYFSFVEGPLKESKTDSTVHIPTESLLMEGARRIDEWSRIEKKIPNLGVVPTLAQVVNGAGGALDLLPEDWEVLAMIDGVRNLHEISKRLNRSDFDVAKTVFGMESTGIVVILDPRTSGAFGDPNTGFEELVVEAEAALLKGDLDEAHRAVGAARAKRSEVPIVAVLTGRIHLARAEHEEADSAFRRALSLEPSMGAAHRLLGDSAALRGKFADAIEWWQRWMRLEEGGNGGSDVPKEAKAAVAAAKTLAEFLKKTHG
ncbi:MAG: DUF4388 domain-containing protein, partial [Gemmatimonadales bacterium]